MVEWTGPIEGCRVLRTATVGGGGKGGLEMFVAADETAARAILAGMWAVTSEGSTGAPDPTDRQAVVMAGRIVFDPPVEVDPGALEPVSPEQIRALVPEDLHTMAARLIGTAALVDVETDPDRLRLAVRYAHALGQHEAWIHELLEVARGHFAWARADMLRRNTESFPRVAAAGGLDHTDAWTADRDSPEATAAGATEVVDNFFFPYTGQRAGDHELAERYATLAELPESSFGRAFHDHYVRHNFRFPGEAHALAESFAVAHDSAHVLAGYDTSMQGELLVATFTGGMMGGDLLATQLFPSIFNDHLDADMHFTFGSGRGWLDPRKFWVAWDRGAAATTSMFDADWDLWAVADHDLDDLRAAYDIPSLDPGDAAEGPDVFASFD